MIVDVLILDIYLQALLTLLVMLCPWVYVVLLQSQWDHQPHHCHHQQSQNHVLLVSYSLLVVSAPVKRYGVHLSVHYLGVCS